MEIASNFVLISCSCLLLGLALFFVYSLAFSTPYYPSSVKKLDKAFKDLGIKVDSNTKFVDLGSGDGRTVIWAAKQGMQATGIELNPYLTLLSRFFVLISRTKSAKILNKSFYKHDFSDYDIVYLYIYPEHMEKMKNKLFSEMKKGSIILSNTFKFKDKEIEKQSGLFYVYKVQ